ncbi:NADPH oxidase 5 [Plakobranchus ocellatus]|uniref:NADPH oxidase 5 n=1 Tax=Plakobranchus ocellatus TaxID=259542 RepID=A0AAV3ZMM4_9GAST|nr:NADPH oxidase 5 [Plakobranchus ocellatus]
MAHARSEHVNGIDNTGYVDDKGPKGDQPVLKNYKGDTSYRVPEATVDSGISPSSSFSDLERDVVVSFQPARSRDHLDVNEDITNGGHDDNLSFNNTAQQKTGQKNRLTPILKKKAVQRRPSNVSFEESINQPPLNGGDGIGYTEGDNVHPHSARDRQMMERKSSHTAVDMEVNMNSGSTVDVTQVAHTMNPDELEETLRKIRRRFAKYANRDNCITEQQFYEALGENKDSFFAERFFHFLDKDRNGQLDMAELEHGARILLSGRTAEKVAFVFTLYDIDGNGTIERSELNQVLTSCVLESKMKLNENEIALLSDTMFDEADTDGDGFMSEENLASMVNKFPNALEALTKNASLWLQSDVNDKKDSRCKCPEMFSRRYIANRYKKLSFLAVFWVLNAALFILNALLYRDSNGYIIFARGCGMCLNFCSALILLLPLRKSISYLRLTPLSAILPLDHNISLHKLVGIVIVVWSVGHTAGHLGNAIWLTERTNLTVPRILFTTDAKIGWVAHLAPLTGVILDVILLIMFVASMPFVRRSGYFQTFYWTHKLYLPYYILTIIHAKNFWKWMLLPGLIFIIETLIMYIRRRGGSTITRISLLPSAVTQLVITKPPGFDFHAGDYVYVKIPVIAKYEWHPFTISSAPEQEDTFWLHIRSAGHWTKKLREHLLTHYSPKKDSVPSTVDMKRRASSIAWFTQRPSMAVAKETSIRRRTITKDVNIQVYVDGPYGSPCREIFETEHAILIGSGIGATPFASILQSITNRYAVIGSF